MLIAFDRLPENARVWVYQSEKRLSPEEIQKISSKLGDFINGWQSHGTDLKGSFKIFYDHFIVIGIDENHYQASGCSIDESVQFIQALEQEFGIQLLSRAKQSYLVDDHVQFFPIQEAKKIVTSGSLPKGTLTFNNTITSKKELESGWLVQAEESWLSRFFK